MVLLEGPLPVTRVFCDFFLCQSFYEYSANRVQKYHVFPEKLIDSSNLQKLHACLQTQVNHLQWPHTGVNLTDMKLTQHKHT